MNKIRVADLNILIKYNSDIMIKQCERYKSDFEHHNIKIDLDESKYPQVIEESFSVTPETVEYVSTGTVFNELVLHFNALMLHSSAVVKDGYAYLFSADSGVGKSTHTGLWQEYFGEDNAIILNDDKPIIRYVDGQLYAYGSPWSGKSDKNANLKVPLGAIVFVERAKENWIKQITPSTAIPLFLTQTLRPEDDRTKGLLLNTLDKILSQTKVYKLGCNISKEAVETSYNAIKVTN